MQKTTQIYFLKKNVSHNELIALYSKAKLFLYPSFYEGFGLPILEAMACGTPVVCSNGSSLVEVGGDSVLFCKPDDENDIKEKILQVLNDEDLRKKLSEKGLQRAQDFTWENSAQKHIEVFEKVVEH